MKHPSKVLNDWMGYWLGKDGLFPFLIVVLTLSTLFILGGLVVSVIIFLLFEGYWMWGVGLLLSPMVVAIIQYNNRDKEDE